MYEHKISFKGYGDGYGYGRDGNGAKHFTYLFNLWFYIYVTTFSLWLLDNA